MRTPWRLPGRRPTQARPPQTSTRTGRSRHRPGPLARHRANTDDQSVAPLPHTRQDGVQDVVKAGAIDGHDAVEVGRVEIGHFCASTLMPPMDDDVQGTKLLDGPGDQAGDVGAIGDVARPVQDRRLAGMGGGSPLKSSAVAIADGHAASLAHECQGGPRPIPPPPPVIKAVFPFNSMAKISWEEMGACTFRLLLTLPGCSSNAAWSC